MFRSKLINFIILFLCVVMSSCGDDNNNIDDSVTYTDVQKTLMEYRWYREWADADETSATIHYYNFYFLSETNGALVWSEESGDAKYGYESSRGERYFTYEVAGSAIKINWSDSKIPGSLKMVNGILQTSAGEPFQKFTISSSEKKDLETLLWNSQNASVNLVGSTYSNSDIAEGQAVFTLKFTSSTSCTLKCSTGGSGTGTYKNNNGTIEISGVYANWDGKKATVKTGSSWGFELRPIGKMYQDNIGTFWTKE